MLLDNKKILHSFGWVRIDKLKSDGIYNDEEKKITHRLQIVKRID